MHLRSTRRSRNDISLNDPIGMDREGNELTLMDVLCANTEDMDELVNHKLLVQRIQENVRYLSPRERKVVELRFGLRDGVRRTQRQVADFLNISRSYVSRIEKRAVHKLCDFLSHESPDKQPENRPADPAS